MKPLIVVASSLCLLLACTDTPKDSAAPPPTGGAFTVKYEEYHAKKCVRDTICATVDVVYPVLQGGNQSAVLQAINDSTAALIGMMIGFEAPRPVPAGFDSASAELYNMLDEQVRTMPDAMPAGFAIEIASKAVWQTPQYLSYEISSYSYAGGAHPNAYQTLVTYDLATGQAVPLVAIVADTNALRRQLETQVVEAKKDVDPAIQLKDILLFPDEPLPLPENFAVTAEGVRFFYNSYEIAAYAFGPTDIMLTWEQLGTLADRSKWLP